jgi:dTDP-4-amino-4,6-dideoxygalactose transaminase
MSYLNTVNVSSIQRARSNFRHLPPTAIEVEWEDLRRGFNSLFQPRASLEEFRLSIQELSGSSTCELVNSGRSALALILLSLKRLSNRSKVILPAYSCSTVVQSVLEAGLLPIFCDLSIENLDLDREHLNQLIDDDILAILPTHLYGLAQDISDLVELGHENGFFVIEDAAQSFGATLGDKLVGTIGDVGFFSLGRGKCIPSGHGGVITASEQCASAISETMQTAVKRSDQRDLGSLVAYLGYAIATKPFVWWFIDHSPLNPADQGMDIRSLPPIEFKELAAVQAGIGNSILDRSQKINTFRQENATRMINLLTEFSFIQFPKIPIQADPVYLRLPFVVDKKSRGAHLFKSLKRQGIGVSKSYYRTLPDLYTDKIRSNQGDFPGARRIAECLYTLPTHSYLNENDLNNIVHTFRSISENREGDHASSST